MPSLRAKFLIFLLKNRHRFAPKSRRLETITSQEDILLFRSNVEEGAEKFGKLPKGVSFENREISGINTYWIANSHAPEDKLILYFHGGGLVAGTAKVHRRIVSNFVNECGIQACVFDYSLAPEKPYPHALNDSACMYKALLGMGYKPENIVFMGDSGGGNLVFTTLLSLKDQEVDLPRAAVALSPWTDLTNSGESYRTNAKQELLTPPGANDTFSRAYCQGHDPRDYLISPLFGDLKGLPPMLLFVGDHEIMMDDTVRFAEKAKDAGIEVKVTVGEGLFHCYPACSPMFPEAKEAMAEIRDFIRSGLKLSQDMSPVTKPVRKKRSR